MMECDERHLVIGIVLFGAGGWQEREAALLRWRTLSSSLFARVSLHWICAHEVTRVWKYPGIMDQMLEDLEGYPRHQKD